MQLYEATILIEFKSTTLGSELLQKFEEVEGAFWFWVVSQCIRVSVGNNF